MQFIDLKTQQSRIRLALDAAMARVLNGNGMAGMDVNAIPHYRASGSGWRRVFSFFQKG
jgi:hypothetical protein